jgi:membrane protease subunit HflK
MVDVEGGNSMMYLPLDKIIGQQTSKMQNSQRPKNNVNNVVPEQNTSPSSGNARSDRFNNGRN